MEVLRVALAVPQQKTYTVAVDRRFFVDLNRDELLRRYTGEGRKIRIVRPSDLELATVPRY